ERASSFVNPPGKPVTAPDFIAAKKNGTKLAILTAYDYTTARLFDAAEADGLLVGDSLGMVVQGQPNPLSVTLEEMIYHTRMVARGAQRALVIADMPFMSYQVSPHQALENAGRLVKEGQAQAIKLEGGERSAPAVAAIAQAGIPVMGHIGLTPQSIHAFGGFRVQRDEERLLEDAKAIEEAGAFSLVVECIPAALAGKITRSVKIPTIGIGAGAACDGQVLVAHDMLGLFDQLKPRFVKQYANLGPIVVQAAQSYAREVRAGAFPGPEHEFK